MSQQQALLPHALHSSASSLQDKETTMTQRSGGGEVKLLRSASGCMSVRKMEVIINRLWRLPKSCAVMGHSGGAGPAHRSPGIMCYHVMIPVPPHEAAA